jgi:hypothetical protein
MAKDVLTFRSRGTDLTHILARQRRAVHNPALYRREAVCGVVTYRIERQYCRTPPTCGECIHRSLEGVFQ